ncbi:MAG TPA: IclR family transcriptional regulator, partial [Mesorhizobium sp.]|nr:IclR family transcriptional regulator [Mesorhizobium sp.]
EIATHGFCTAIGTWRPDVSAVGVPFIDPRTGRVFSFSCSGIGYTIEEERLRSEIGPRMVELVDNVAAAMGTSPRP